MIQITTSLNSSTPKTYTIGTGKLIVILLLFLLAASIVSKLGRLLAGNENPRASSVSGAHDKDDPRTYAEILLTKHLRTEGLLASEVHCTQINAALEPLCTASVQPVSGGPVSKQRYSARAEMTWNAY